MAGGTARATFVTVDGNEAIYFGKCASGQAMSFRDAANPEDVHNLPDAVHVFGVVGYYESQGAPFSIAGGSSETLIYGKVSSSVGAPLADASRLWRRTANLTAYLDGERFDLYNDVPPAKKFVLLDIGGPYKGNVSGFFGLWTDKSYWGGDYLSEALVFTNALTEIERLQVSAYLSKKWFGAENSKVKLALESTGAYAVDASTDDVTANGTTVSGYGQVVKTGANAFYYRATDPLSAEATSLDGSIDIRAGAFDMSTRLPVRVAPGKVVSTTTAEGGQVRVTVVPGKEGEFVKEGTNDLSVVGLDASVKSLRIKAGTLDVRPVRTSAHPEADDDEIFIENPSFEDFAEECSADGGWKMTWTDAGHYYKGWRANVNTVLVFDWERWTGTSAACWNGTRSTYSYNHHPRDGKVFVVLYQNSLLATPVTISRPGTYELDVDICARELTGIFGYYAKFMLYDTVRDKEVAVFGCGHYYEHDYHHLKLRAEVPETGTFELRARGHNLHSDRPIVVDNFRLRRVTDVEFGRYDVPNGSFEAGEHPKGSEAMAEITESPYENWTFNRGEGEVCIINRQVTNATTKADGHALETDYNVSRGPRGGFRQLQLKKGSCSATVTFTPPSGRHFLRADLARYYQVAGNLTATAIVGEAAPVTLGTVAVANTLMRACTWPTAFEADGKTSVSITFAFTRKSGSASASTGVLLDDVRLVGSNVNNGEYLRNGSFETTSSLRNWAADWSRIVVSDNDEAKIGIESVQPYSYLPNVFAPDRIDGKYFIYLGRNGGAKQDVTFDQAGRYRLSFYHALSVRAYSNAHYAKSTPLRAWLAKGGVTNVIGTTGSFSNTNFVQTVWEFDVPEAATYVFGIQGTMDVTTEPNACVDALSIRRVDTTKFVETAPSFDPDTAVRIDAGARMRLSFEGTQKIRRLVLGGTSVGYGEIDIADYPEYFEGKGKFDVEPTRGLLILVR